MKRVCVLCLCLILCCSGVQSSVASSCDFGNIYRHIVGDRGVDAMDSSGDELCKCIKSFLLANEVDSSPLKESCNGYKIYHDLSRVMALISDLETHDERVEACEMYPSACEFINLLSMIESSDAEHSMQDKIDILRRMQFKHKLSGHLTTSGLEVVKALHDQLVLDSNLD